MSNTNKAHIATAIIIILSLAGGYVIAKIENNYTEFEKHCIALLFTCIVIIGNIYFQIIKRDSNPPDGE